MDATFSVGRLSTEKEQRGQQSEERAAPPGPTQQGHDGIHPAARARPRAAGRWCLAIRCGKTLAAHAHWGAWCSGAGAPRGSAPCWAGGHARVCGKPLSRTVGVRRLPPTPTMLPSLPRPLAPSDAEPLSHCSEPATPLKARWAQGQWRLPPRNC